MAREHSSLPMERYSRADGKMDKNMERVS